MYSSIRPGQVWYDTEGKRIQAHGGSVTYIDGTYYWYGENKEKTDPAEHIWHWGVRCYSSKDLYNWQDEGIIIPPTPNDEKSTLHPSRCMDRPHIIYNKRTKKYVAWLKIMEPDCQDMTVLTADSLLGPYTLVHEHVLPMGMSSGDFDLVVAEDGKAYWYFERPHSELICADLNTDYTDVTGYYSTHFPHHDGPPFVREAPAHFQRGSKHYLITSGTSGYYPNPSEVAVADTWHGPFTVLGDPHVGDCTHTSFHSQISSVFKVHGKKDLYIACADRWLVNILEDTYDDIGPWFYRLINGNRAEADKLAAKMKVPLPVAEQTSIADYVWLPIVFEAGMPKIYWKDEWKIEDFE